MKQDRFLMIILGIIGALMVAAIALFFIRQNSQTYGPEDTPDGVLRNYMLAINREDYAKAYGYLQDAERKPDLDEFEQILSRKKQTINQTALKIVAVEITEERAEIEVIVTREGSDPFDDRFSTHWTIVLVLQDGVWKLTRMPYPFGY